MSRLTIGAVTTELDTSWPVAAPYDSFREDQTPLIALERSDEDFSPLPPVSFTPPGGMWDLRSDPEWHYFTTYAPDAGMLDRRLKISHDFRRGRLFSPRHAEPFSYPLDELILTGYLATGLGVMVHACGLAVQQQGWIFPGPSGAGKSTLARLALASGLTPVLSDDRIIVRPLENDIQIFGTPWHGDSPIVSAARVPLRGIAFLRHGPTNRLRPLSKGQAAARLLANSFSPLWDRAACARLLAVCTDIVSRTPAYELEFLPDIRLFQLLRNHG